MDTDIKHHTSTEVTIEMRNKSNAAPISHRIWDALSSFSNNVRIRSIEPLLSVVKCLKKSYQSFEVSLSTEVSGEHIKLCSNSPNEKELSHLWRRRGWLSLHPS